MQRKIRVLVGKPGLDGHDRGAKVVAAALRDNGMEVIYTGLHQTPEQIVEAAVQEDVDVVALSVLSGAHMTLFPEVLELMKSRAIGEKLLTGGGIIPAEDMQTLANLGVGRLFGPGASTQDIGQYIRAWLVERHGADAFAPPPPPAPRHEPMVSAEELALPRPKPAKPAPARSAPRAKAKKPAAKAKRKPASKAKPAAKKRAKPAAKKKAAVKRGAARPRAAAKKKPAARRGKARR